MRPNSFIKKLVVLGAVVGSLVAPFCNYPKLQAAERFEIHFDGMSIPISIKELIDWSNGVDEKNSELANWLNLLGFKERKGLAKFLNTPLVRDKSMARQILRSWSGRKLLDEVSDLILMDEDSSGESVLDTLENLLNEKDEVTTFDLLNSLSVKAIHIDLDGWIEVANNWKSELRRSKVVTSSFSFKRFSNVSRTLSPELSSSISIRSLTSSSNFRPDQLRKICLAILLSLTKGVLKNFANPFLSLKPSKLSQLANSEFFSSVPLLQSINSFIEMGIDIPSK